MPVATTRTRTQALQQLDRPRVAAQYVRAQSAQPQRFLIYLHSLSAQLQRIIVLLASCLSFREQCVGGDVLRTLPAVLVAGTPRADSLGWHKPSAAYVIPTSTQLSCLLQVLSARPITLDGSESLILR